MFAHLCKFTKIAQLTWVNVSVCELQLNKAVLGKKREKIKSIEHLKNNFLFPQSCHRNVEC